MAVNHHFTILCEYVMQDAENNCTFAGTYTNIRFEEFPSYRRLGIGVGFDGDTDDDVLAITVNDPDGETLSIAVLSRIDNPRPQKHEFDLQLNTLALAPIIEFTKEGVYHIVLNANGQPVHKRPFGIYLKPPVQVESVKSNDDV